VEEPDTYARTVDDPAGWLREHQATGSVRDEPCFEVRAGVPPEAALLCRARLDQTTVERVYVIAAGHLREVWQGPVATYANWVDLVVEIASDGEELVLRDRRGAECTDALSEAVDKWANGVDDAAFVRRIVDACKARGTYTWTGRSYVRASP
jgi:hypothetical protein